MSNNLNIVVIGGSRNIGYWTSLQFLKNTPSTVTFLLRNPSVFDEDSEIQTYVKSGQARLVKGDALSPEDMKNLWSEATKERPIDVILFTVGFTGNPKFHPLKGFLINPANLVTQALLNVLCTVPQTPALPKVVTLSTLGVTSTSRSASPLLLKPLYGYLIAPAMDDKLGMERVIAHCAGWEWNLKDGEPSDEIMGADWRNPALLTDGECLADGESTKQSGKKPYRAVVGDVAGYTVSRKDVAHFVYEILTEKWQEFGGKQVGISY
ncbi:hypothetical protein CVT24_011158 [Panaeolus cyanescens]|uniref:NAD(P)-binding domain-containing protein n=1 Tax=Panaeolus cyanescens TaxID=181874 RepID=A0A409YGB3_9AGAR|nr:hypothetical protein CVT24_011158 [Panaeolus cyanescens]